MQVILLETVPNLGNLGEIVKVKDGHARNFLIPTRQARRATPQAIADVEARREELEKADKEKLASAKSLGEKLNGLTIQITQKAGVDGRLFGSVTKADIAEALKAQNFIVEREHIRMPDGSLKMIGDHPISIGLHRDVVVDIVVSVLGEHV